MNNRVRSLLKWTGRTISIFAWVGIAVWLIGRIVSDRYAWSQWLLWIPTPAMLPVVVIGWISLCFPASGRGERSRRIIAWCTCTVLISIYFLTIEHRFFHTKRTPNSTAIRLIHWNMNGTANAPYESLRQFLLEIDGDITVITTPGRVFRDNQLRYHLGGDQSPVRAMPVVVFSRFPILTVRRLVSVDRIYVTLVEVDTSELFRRPLLLYLVDLPSNPTVNRFEVAARVRTFLDEANIPEPDIIVGDCNITRGSTALKHMFPNVRHAYDEAGSGYGASYPRGFPLYHIDHVLLGHEMKCEQYDLLDPGHGLHCVQQAMLTTHLTP